MKAFTKLKEVNIERSDGTFLCLQYGTCDSSERYRVLTKVKDKTGRYRYNPALILSFADIYELQSRALESGWRIF